MNNLFIVLNADVDFGLMITLVGFILVTFTLALLFILFAQMPKILAFFSKRKKPATDSEKQVIEIEHGIEGNVTAAIGFALHMYLNDQHDEESNVVTIKQVRRAYSPWSSKIYSVRHAWPRG